MYRMSNIIQGLLWLVGLSLHNTYAGECCPDMSCCSASSGGHKVRTIIPFKKRAGYLINTWIVRPFRPVYFRLFHPKVRQDRLCSGYKMFPDGSVCGGCLDCYTKAR